MEPEPKLEITVEGEKFYATRQNASVFTFLGDMAVYDHVFIVVDEARGEAGYLFKNSPVYDEMVAFMINHAFPAHLNLEEPAECDLQAFDQTMYSDIRTADSFPEEWLQAS